MNIHQPLSALLFEKAEELPGDVSAEPTVVDEKSADDADGAPATDEDGEPVKTDGVDGERSTLGDFAAAKIFPPGFHQDTREERDSYAVQRIAEALETLAQREIPRAESIADALPEIVAQINAGFMAAVERNAQVTRDLIASMHKADQKNMQRLISAITAPKRIVHDDDGRPVGLEPNTD